ncbi:MAG: membrane protein insertion efficiency factor YidD [Bordetella sp.]|nr:MAG: membrane protein insertion efficiency factor YidD [Bordetella sp.]
MKIILLFIIKFYQYFFSPLIGNQCRFTPSCSNFAIEAIEKFGVIIGLYLIVKRLFFCQPWSKGGKYPVPLKVDLFFLPRKFKKISQK